MQAGVVEIQDWDQKESGTDQHLALLARTETAAFAELYHRYADDVLRYCLRRLGDRMVAEDATSQTFEQALRAIRRFRSDSFRAWLFTIARNVTIDLHRRQHHHASLPDGDVFVDQSALPERDVLARDDARRLRLLLRLLSSDQREVMELRLADLSNAEIGKVLGKRPGAVRVSAHRAVVTLRKRMKEYGFAIDD
jgi:RNA polymerase sigma-70 factor (ECF subfamily)